MFVEKLDDLPETLRGDFVEAEYNGKKGYQHKDTVALANAMRNAKSERDEFKGKLNELLSKAEEDRIKAEQAALERLKKEGKVDEILADYDRRANETKAQYEARIEKLATQIKSEKRASLVGEIADGLSVFPESKKLFEKLIRDRIDVDPETGKVMFLDESGGATALDKAGFMAELAKDSAYDRLRKAEANRGGNANGNSGNGGGAAKKLSDLTGEERTALAKTDPEALRRLVEEAKRKQRD